MGKTRAELVEMVSMRLERQAGFSIDAPTARRRARRIIEDLDECLVVDAEPDSADVS